MSNLPAPQTNPNSTGVSIELPQGVEPSLNELFERNPLDWSDSDLSLVIQHMRKAREIFHKEDTAAKSAGRRVNAKGALAKGSPAQLDLSSLGL